MVVVVGYPETPPDTEEYSESKGVKDGILKSAAIENKEAGKERRICQFMDRGRK